MTYFQAVKNGTITAIMPFEVKMYFDNGYTIYKYAPVEMDEDDVEELEESLNASGLTV